MGVACRQRARIAMYIGNVGCKKRVEPLLLRWIKPNLRIVRCARNGVIDRDVSVHRRQASVAFIGLIDRIDRFEGCDIDDRHGTRRSCRPKLLAKNPDLTLGRLDRRMVDRSAVERDFVPQKQPVECAHRVARQRGS